MTGPPLDPLEPGGIKEFGDRLRSGKITAEAAIATCLARIEALEPRLGAFEHVAAEHALAVARALDTLLAAGTDLGPLMGVPVAVKDIIAVDGMPTTAGSNLDVTDLVGPEGSFIKTIKRCGCVIVGKTKTPEFAMGGGRFGINTVRATPWNPWDAKTRRVPGGSSSGSAVAVAAGLCAFAIGSDTGASVRLPAAFCGVFGLKTTAGLWPLDGVFPLYPTLDTLGTLTKSAADGAIVFAAITQRSTPAPAPPRGLRLGKPANHFFDDLEPCVEKCTRAALAALEDSGVEIIEVEVPEAAETLKVPGFFRPSLSPASVAKGFSPRAIRWTPMFGRPCRKA